LITHVRRVRRRPNFTIRAGALVDRVLHRSGSAYGVAYIDPSGALAEVRGATVALCAGAYGSAPILLRSGIGPPHELSRHGIAPALDLPVGEGLMEHAGIFFQASVAEWAARGGWPAMAVAARGDGWWAIPGIHDEERALASVGMYLGIPDPPRGRVTLASPDPTASPDIDHAYADVIHNALFESVWRDYRRLLATDSLSAIEARERRPEMPLDERLRRWLMTGAHPAGGCAIGAVVDPDLRVYGIENLMVADASIFPMHVTNNPNITCHMVGERAAAVLAGRRQLVA
jgi:choline dehydrogenase